MKIIGFIVLCVGLVLGWWWLALIGFAIYESTGVVWMAAALGHGNHNDHGP